MNVLSTLSNATGDDEVVVPQLVQMLSAKRRRRRRKNGIGYKRKGKRKCKKAPPSSLLAKDDTSLGQPSQALPVASPPSPSNITPPFTSDSSNQSSTLTPSNSPTSNPSPSATPTPASPSPPTIATPIQRGPKGRRLTVAEAENMRGGVAFIFRSKYAETYSPEKLNGPDGIVHSICKDLGYFQPSGVRRIVLEVYAAMVEKKEYDRKKKKYVNSTHNN